MSVELLAFYAAVIYLSLGIRIAKPGEWLVVRRLGRYVGFRREGIRWVVPILDQTVRVELGQVSQNWRDTPEKILEAEVNQYLSTQTSS